MPQCCALHNKLNKEEVSFELMEHFLAMSHNKMPTTSHVLNRIGTENTKQLDVVAPSHETFNICRIW